MRLDFLVERSETFPLVQVMTLYLLKECYNSKNLKRIIMTMYLYLWFSAPYTVEQESWVQHQPFAMELDLLLKITNMYIFLTQAKNILHDKNT